MIQTTDSLPLSDRILLGDHVVETEIGAFTEERGVTQRLIFNIALDVLPPEEAVGDDVDRILSYDLLVDAVEAELAAARVDLLETLAEGIAQRLLTHPRAAMVRIRIEKPDRVSGRLGVEIARAGSGAGSQEAAMPAARVYCLPPGAAAQAWFPSWAAGLAAGPVVLAVEGAAVAGEDPAARRGRFLACEIAAWEVQSALPGSDVVSSRTEFAHAFKQGRPAIWAPSRMIFAARGLGDAVLGDFGRAADWFAQEIGAAALIYVGREAPEGLGFEGPVDVVRPGP